MISDEIKLIKIFTAAIFVGALSITVHAQDPSGTPSQATGQAGRTAAQREANIELYEAARAYRESNFAEAQWHSERALALDPDNKTAPFFVARTIHRQYKRGDQTPENISKALQAIDAYKRIIQKDPENEEAFKAIADLYGALKENELQRQWILQRATDPAAEPAKRAMAYTILSTKDWHCK